MLLRELAEFKTFLLIVACYASIGFLLVNPLDFMPGFQILMLAPLVTLHASLQHEAIHGHPFKSQGCNDLLMLMPVGIFVAYYRFSDLHRAHHQTEIICDPYTDPESFYQSPSDWSAAGGFCRRLLVLNNTLCGRMILGPVIGLWRLYSTDLVFGDSRVYRIWGIHILLSILYLYLLALVSSMSVWAYLLCSYLAFSLLMVRTFLEHQADEDFAERSVIIDARCLFSFLFLNNNLHAVHHAYPSLAWYRLPAFFTRNRARFVRHGGGYYFSGYGEIFRRYFFTAKEPVAYPLESEVKK